MIRKVGFRFAVLAMMSLLIVVIVYHVLIITGVIPYEATWGGKLKTKEEMYRFEAISISMNLLIFLVVAIKGGYVKAIRPGKLITLLLWVFAVLFALNTLGNILSENSLETIIFTPITLLFSLFCYRMAVERT